ncbi:MAG: sialidase family protein [Ferruginibacter sp.]
MKKYLAFIFLTNLFFFGMGTRLFCQKKIIPVFISGTEGHKSYRIPAIIKLPNKNLLAFCEGRVKGSGDFGDINIVMKKSLDGGNTWSDLQTIVDADSLQAGNPAPVVDITDPVYPNGRIFLFYNTGNNHESEVRKGNGIREVWYKTSIDAGLTWSNPVNITLQTHRPLQPQISASYNFSADWRSYANTPGHAIQFTNGIYKGRIFVAANHSAGGPQKQYMDYAAHGFYSDDHGANFQLSESVSLPGSNESTAAELSKNNMMMNSRNQKGDIKARIVSLSNDGGATWNKTYFDTVLIDPINQGSLLAIGSKKGNTILAFCNTADTKKRDHLTLRISFDEGITWKKSILIDQSTSITQKDYTAYSDLVLLHPKKIGILYERDNYSQIVFTIVPWKK